MLPRMWKQGRRQRLQLSTKHARDMPFTVNEEWAIFWNTRAPDPEFHVSGDLRKLLVSRARRYVLAKLQSTRSQGDIARRMESKLLTHFDMVRKLGDANLLLYLLLAPEFSICSS
jgi:hypothetical protein